MNLATEDGQIDCIQVFSSAESVPARVCCTAQLRAVSSYWLEISRNGCVVALVLSRLDYSNANLAGLPACLVNRLQSVLNDAARSIAGLRLSNHITDTRSRQFSLATSTRANQVQVGSHGLPRSAQYCASIPV